MPTADELFRAELDRRGIAYSVTSEGLYDVDVGGMNLSTSLENIRRNYERDGNDAAVVEFVDRLTIDYFGSVPSWDEVCPYLRYSLEPMDHGTALDEVLFDRVTDKLCKVYVYTPADGSFIAWINHFTVEDWGVSRDEIVRQAEANMREIVGRTKFECTDVDGVKLGMLSTEETPFKASLILSPAFRDLVAPEAGWPVYVVVPCRDFAYVIAVKDREFLGRMGGVVIKQYRESGYPITKDVLEVSDLGVAAIGTYPEPE
jgi:uncharacterized protein YtpQ (UPF0354 family)